MEFSEPAHRPHSLVNCCNVPTLVRRSCGASLLFPKLMRSDRPGTMAVAAARTNFFPSPINSHAACASCSLQLAGSAFHRARANINIIHAIATTINTTITTTTTAAAAARTTTTTTATASTSTSTSTTTITIYIRETIFLSGLFRTHDKQTVCIQLLLRTIQFSSAKILHHVDWNPQKAKPASSAPANTRLQSKKQRHASRLKFLVVNIVGDLRSSQEVKQ
jgi:hypothetical protein